MSLLSMSMPNARNSPFVVRLSLMLRLLLLLLCTRCVFVRARARPRSRVHVTDCMRYGKVCHLLLFICCFCCCCSHFIGKKRENQTRMCMVHVVYLFEYSTCDEPYAPAVCAIVHIYFTIFLVRHFFYVRFSRCNDYCCCCCFVLSPSIWL